VGDKKRADFAPTITGVIRRLEGLGLVRRSARPQPTYRAVLVDITVKVLALQREALADIQARLSVAELAAQHFGRPAVAGSPADENRC
jgi:DNA-binding MarR family transcriptional regulator